MLYRITFLKAPWPAGAMVGDVLELASVPAWALGKCEPAGEGAVATDFGGLVSEGTGEPMVPADGDTVTGDGSGEPLPASVFLSTDGVTPLTRQQLEAQAKDLGVSFNSRTTDAVLIARILEAEGTAP